MSKPTTAELITMLHTVAGFHHTDNNLDLQLKETATRLETAEATIARVEPLVEKWQTAPTDYVYEIAFKEGMEYCANELQAILNRSEDG